MSCPSRSLWAWCKRSACPRTRSGRTLPTRFTCASKPIFSRTQAVGAPSLRHSITLEKFCRGGTLDLWTSKSPCSSSAARIRSSPSTSPPAIPLPTLSNFTQAFQLQQSFLTPSILTSPKLSNFLRRLAARLSPGDRPRGIHAAGGAFGLPRAGRHWQITWAILA